MGHKLINEVGNRYGRLTVLKEVGRNKYNGVLWLCKCDCGNEKSILGTSLRDGSTKSCGCLGKEIRIKNGQLNKINEVGNRYGRLTVLKEVRGDKYNKVLWLCKCDCGNLTTVVGNSLRSGATKSCGCLRREIAKNARKGKSPSNILPKGEATFNTILKQMKNNAKNRQLEWSISDETVRKLILQSCFYCGALPRTHTFIKKRHSNGDFPCNGLDRVDNSKGYSEDNVVPCCRVCNFAKGTMSFSEFKQFVDRVSKHLSNIESV